MNLKIFIFFFDCTVNWVSPFFLTRTHFYMNENDIIQSTLPMRWTYTHYIRTLDHIPFHRNTTSFTTNWSIKLTKLLKIQWICSDFFSCWCYIYSSNTLAIARSRLKKKNTNFLFALRIDKWSMYYVKHNLDTFNSMSETVQSVNRWIDYQWRNTTQIVSINSLNCFNFA